MTTLSYHAQDGNPLRLPTTSGIYKITCIANKRFYIGSTNNLRLRKNRHFNDLRQNKHTNSKLQRTWNKYGEASFLFEVLELVLPMSLTAREQYWLNKFKPFGNKGFNIARDTTSSCLGRKQSPEHIAKRTRGQCGKHLSPEHCEKVRQARLGQKLSPEHIEKIRQGNKDYAPRRKRNEEGRFI